MRFGRRACYVQLGVSRDVLLEGTHLIQAMIGAIYICKDKRKSFVKGGTGVSYQDRSGKQGLAIRNIDSSVCFEHVEAE